MVLSSSSKRRLLRPAAGLLVAGGVLLGFAAAASADSNPITPIVPGACVGGTVNRSVTVKIDEKSGTTDAARLYVVSGTPGGPVIDTLEQSFTAPTIVTFDLTLPAGTYYFDWADHNGSPVDSGNGVGWSLRHSALGDFYNSLFVGTKTDVAECVVATTTTVAETTTTVAETTTTTAATTTSTTLVVGPPTTPAVTTSIAIAPPTTGTAAPTTAVVQTTAAVSANTLPATGGNNAPLIGGGIAFLGLGAGALATSRRRRPAHEL